MEKSTLIEILRTFSKEELANFSDFVTSPYHNKKSNVTKLYKALRKQAPDFTPAKITKEEMWKHIFPGKKYNYGIMKNLIYDLNKLAVKFLELEMYSQKQFDNDLNQLDAFKLKNLRPQFIKKSAESRKNLEAQPLDNQTYYRRYMLNCSEMSLFDYNSRRFRYHFDEINESLALFYYTNQLYHNTNSVGISFFVSLPIDKEAHTSIIERYENCAYKDPYADVLKFSYLAQSGEGSKEDYEKLKKVFFENYKKCAKTVQHDLATLMVNFCMNNARRGNSQFAEEGSIYIKLIMEDELYKAGTFVRIDQYQFVRYVVSECSEGRFDRAEKFIKEHSHELPEDMREQFTNYSYISLYQGRGRFKEALHYISKCRKADDVDRLNLKMFEFISYYELGYYDELKALADSTNHMLRTDKLFSTKEKTYNKNYIKVISWLMDYKYKVGSRYKDPDFLPNIINFVNKNEMRYKLWLLRKIDELKNNESKITESKAAQS
ncbi:MAG: hypothetical protein IAE90_05085 [Ignavibacteria bacterium]|nr:hypothetical protein [Ignavibacteria bacterium]